MCLWVGRPSHQATNVEAGVGIRHDTCTSVRPLALYGLSIEQIAHVPTVTKAGYRY